MSRKKPDHIVFNEEEQRYDASLKPYATDLAAPKITTPDTVAWKNTNIHKVNHHINSKYKELKAEYEKLMAQYEYNNLVYNARFTFEPIVGQRYHLYKDENAQSFLSIIAPNECNFDYVGSFRLNADKLWEKLELHP